MNKPQEVSTQYKERLERAMTLIERLKGKLSQQNQSSASTEPIAIVSMACRFPGSVADPEGLWELLENGRDAITQVPSDRWDAEELYDGAPAVPGKVINKQGGFIDKVKEFDPLFFGISPKEAHTMDPQQRILMEVSYEALVRLGMNPKQASSIEAGVFVGVSGTDYARHLSQLSGEQIDPYLATGNSASVLAGRLSYVLRMTGPSLSIDTSCSSSLVAVHLACQSLQNQECELALAGGVNCILTPEVSIAFSQARMLSPRGRCHTFSSKADGFVRAEGCGMVALKKLSKARVDGDQVLGIIRGSAINQDGGSGGLTVPNGHSQQKLIQSALKTSGASPEDLYYLEAHGTGTELGDPVELNALSEVFKESHSPERPLLIGSIKTNLGHMEAAAGIGGLMKVVLSMQHGMLPKHLHFSEPTPHVKWDKIPIKVTDQKVEWPRGSSSLAGVSSFGFSGTNAHVILERSEGSLKNLEPVPSTSNHKRRYWVDIPKNKKRRPLLSHPWLQEMLSVARINSKHLVVSQSLFRDDVLKQHQVLGQAVFPGVGFLELLSAAFKHVYGSKNISLKDVSFARVLSLDSEMPVQIVLKQDTAEVLQQTETGEWQTLCVTMLDQSYQKVHNLSISDFPRYELSEVAPSHVYERLASQGVSYGEAWKLIESLQTKDGYIRAHIKAPQESGGFHYHPFLLDAILQTMAAGFLEKEDDKYTYIPEGVGQVIFHVEKLCGEVFTVLGKMKSGEGWVSADFLLQDEEGADLVTFKDIRLRPLTKNWITRVNRASVKDWFYSVDWKLDNIPSREKGHTPEQLARQLMDDAKEALEVEEIKRYREGLPNLERAAAQLAGIILSKVDSEKVIPEQKVLWRHLHNRAQTEILETSTFTDELQAVFPQEIKLIQRCASEAVAVVEGDQDPMEVLFPKGDSSELTWLYQKSDAAQLLNKQMCLSFAQIRKGLGRPLKILEVGGGTGGTTALLIELLGKDDEYVFTDVSPFLVDEAKQKFGHSEQMLFKTLDLSQSLLEQGFDRNTYDLVIAANVLHATPDIDSSVRKIGELLLTNGYLLLLEGVKPLLWLDLIFGLTKGWWSFNDEWRVDYPLLSSTTWHKLFNSMGWESSTITVGDLPQAVMVAQKRAEKNEKLVIWAEHRQGAGTFAEQIQAGVRNLLSQVKACLSGKPPWPQLVLVTQGATDLHAFHPEQATLWGLSRTIELEFPGLQCLRIDLDPTKTLAEQRDLVNQELENLSRGSVRFRDGKRYVARLQHAEKIESLKIPETDAYELKLENTPTRSLTLAEVEREKPICGDIEIRVQAAGINFIDGLDIAGMLPFERGWLGVECAGEVVSVGDSVTDFKIGDKVMALAPRAFRTYVNVPSVLVAKWPNNIKTAQAAATLPVNFLTAQRALCDIAHLKKGESVLIHSGAGGTGMAAIQVAQHLGATVYATSSRAKWPVLKRLGVKNIFDSRSLGFAVEVIKATQGQGVQVVLNSLTGDYIEKGLSILAKDGRFIELGKRGIWTKEQIGEFRSDIQYHIVDLFSESEQRIKLWRSEGKGDSIFKGLLPVQALPETSFPIQEAPRAVKFFQRSRHVGKVVLDFDRTQSPVRQDASYVITGGAGGLGLETARWLVEQGARHVLLLGRNIPKSDDPRLLIIKEAIEKNWVWFESADVSERAAVEGVLKHAQERAPLRGIFHSAGVLSNATIQELSWDEVNYVFGPKVWGGWHLHELTAHLELDLFVLYSSAASLLGSPGQGNHVAANAFLDALAHHRRSLGLPAQSFNWGAWSQVGSAASQSTQMELAKRGISMIDPQSGIKCLSLALQRPDCCQLGLVRVDWKTLLKAGLSLDPFFEYFARSISKERHENKALKTGKEGEWIKELKNLPRGQWSHYLNKKIREELAQVIGLQAGDLPPADAGFFDLGVDSLMSVDLKNRLALYLATDISPTLIFQHPTISALAQKLTELLENQMNVLGKNKIQSKQSIDVSTLKLDDDSETKLLVSEVSGKDIASELLALEELLEESS
ncbi:MAG: SDR family NAD(P)-dependent oxidoreductase [Verrucomicrobiota bacterium]